MPGKQPAILLTWVAVNNDPYERDRGTGEYRRVGGELVPGPTLALLTGDSSPYKDVVKEIVLFHRKAPDGSKEATTLRETVAAICEQMPGMRIRDVGWKGDDPTDHNGIYRFLRKELPALRDRYKGQRFVVHVSPGTPAMHTVWVLMVETGMITQPVELVKSYRQGERTGQPSVVPVKLGLDTFFKVYQRQQGHKKALAEEDQIFWNPTKFQSPRLKQVFAEARRFAQVNVPLLILGERGTGKTTLASWIRANSAFRVVKNDANWPSVPCGQYNPETMRSELFGYKKGAFTGATDDKEGLLARADGDTLFLDEIGDISPPLQRLLIRALEENVYSPLGSTEVHKSRFRLITATNRKQGILRKDLDPDFLDRISMLTIEMPPLREIREDIPWIWSQVVSEAAKRSACHIDDTRLTKVSELALPNLMKEALPGNMRDLFVVAYRLIAMLADDEEAISDDCAVGYALGGLVRRSVDNKMVERGIMGCFAESESLDHWVESLGRLDTKNLITEVRRYLAHEIRRYAHLHGVQPEEVCDVAGRTLRQWAD